MTENEISKEIVGSDYLVHNTLGPGHLDLVRESMFANGLIWGDKRLGLMKDVV